MQSAYRVALTTDFDYDLRKMKLLAPYWAKHHRLKVQPYFVRDDMNAYFDSLYAQTAFRDTAEINTYMATDCFEAFSEDSVISHWLQFDRLIDEVYRPALDRSSANSPNSTKSMCAASAKCMVGRRRPTPTPHCA